MHASTKYFLAEVGRVLFWATVGVALLSILAEWWHPGLAAAGVSPGWLIGTMIFGMVLESAFADASAR